MDGIIWLGLLAAVVILVGSFGGLLAIGRCSALEQDLRKLRQRLEALEARVGVPVAAAARQDAPSQAPAEWLSGTAQPTASPPLSPPLISSPPISSPPISSPPLTATSTSAPVPDPARDTNPAPAAMAAASERAPDVTADEAPPAAAPSARVQQHADALRFEQAVASRWLVWVGGLALALGAVFLVKLGIDEGLFGPLARVCAGLALGVGLLVGSEVVRRRSAPLPDSELDYVPAALAGGGVVAGYASLLAAFDRYQLLPAVPTFILLALLSLSALLLALRQGPLLAVLGLFGGYLVPVLVSTGHGSLPGLLGYVGLISAAGLLLQSQVQRRWLWWGTLLAHGLWLLLVPELYQGEQGFLFAYLLGSLYLFCALPALGWRWQLRFWHWPLSWRPCRPAVLDVHWVWLFAGLLWLVWMRWLAMPLLGWSMLAVLMLAAAWLAWRSPALMLLPLWCGLLLVLATLTASSHWGYLPALSRPELASSALWALWRPAMVLALLAALLAWPRLRHGPHCGLWGSLLAGLPLLVLALIYWRQSGVDALLVRGDGGLWADAHLLWPLQALGWFLLCSWLVWRHQWPRLAARVALLAGGQAALTLACWMFFAESSLTLALAVQLAALARLAQREGDLIPHWLIKLLAMLVVGRLSLNPWLLEYPLQGVAGVHWSLYGYGIPVLCLWLAARWLPWRPGQQTQRWLEAGVIQLLTLWLAVEGRYWLTDGQPWSAPFGLLDTAFLSAGWGAMALIYGWKSRLGGPLAAVYRWAAPLLLGLMLLLTTFGSSLWFNPCWRPEPVGSWPLLNLTLVAWGMPTLIALLAIRLLPLPRGLERLVAGFGFVCGLLYLTLMVRQVWQGTLLNGPSLPSGEQYSYSALWLLTAVVVMWLGGRFGQMRWRQASLLILLLAVLKIFLWDMADLTGLYRALSFLGLGLCLVGVGWFYQHKVLPAARQQVLPPLE